MEELYAFNEDEIYEKYPFLEGDFWVLILKKDPNMALLLQQLGLDDNKVAIAKILDTDINKIFREHNQQMSELAICLSGTKMFYKNFIKHIKSRGKEAIGVGAYEDVPIGLLEMLVSSTMGTYLELLQLHVYDENTISFSKAYPNFETAVKGYGAKEDRLSFNRYFIRRWFGLDNRKDNKHREYDEMINFFSSINDVDMIDIVNSEYADKDKTAIKSLK